MEDAILPQRAVYSLANAFGSIRQHRGFVVAKLVRQMRDDFVACLEVCDLGADILNDTSTIRTGDEVFVAEFEAETALTE